MNSDSKIYVAGHTGLIGSAVLKCLGKTGFRTIITRSSTELDLTNQIGVREFFRLERPEYVILAAGKVGGIAANTRYPGDFIYKNLAIQTNVLEAARVNAVKKLIFFGSSCMYPVSAAQPMQEEGLCAGELEETSIAYAIAKLAGVQMCLAFNKQDRERRFIPIIPNSTYGENDDLDPESGHVLSALIRRVDDAKENGEPNVQLWGSGKPEREFIHSSDVATACLRILESDLSAVDFPINVGTGEEISIEDLANLVVEVIGYKGGICWDSSKPDGASRKLLDSQRIRSLRWRPTVGLREGIARFYDWYLKQRRIGEKTHVS